MQKQIRMIFFGRERAPGWQANLPSSSSGGLAVIGAPLRLGLITPGRCDLAPAAVRSILRKFSCYDIESDADLRLLAARDLGDLPLADLKPEDAFEPLRDAVRNALAGADAVVVIGGDNAVTRPAFTASRIRPPILLRTAA